MHRTFVLGELRREAMLETPSQSAHGDAEDRHMQRQSLLLSSLLFQVAMATPLGARGDVRLESSVGDVPFELVGQVQNFSGPPATSLQFGYLSAIEGLDGIFTTSVPTLQNEATALFTFFNESETQRVINHGKLRIINRVGTTTIYFDDTPDGDFVTPRSETFADGLKIQTSTFRHQVILDTMTSTFTTVFVNEVTSVEPFVFNGHKTRLGKAGDTLRIWVSGLPVVPPARFEIAGYAVAADPSYFVDDGD